MRKYNNIIGEHRTQAKLDTDRLDVALFKKHQIDHDKKYKTYKL